MPFLWLSVGGKQIEKLPFAFLQGTAGGESFEGSRFSVLEALQASKQHYMIGLELRKNEKRLALKSHIQRTVSESNGLLQLEY